MECHAWKQIKHLPIFKVGPTYPGTGHKVMACKQCRHCTWIKPNEILELLDGGEVLSLLPYRGFRPKAKPFCRLDSRYIYQKVSDMTVQCHRW